MTVKVCPAIVIVPERGVVLGFAATEYVAVVLPDPTPDVMVNQGALLVELQRQPDGAVTETVPLPPLTLKP